MGVMLPTRLILPRQNQNPTGGVSCHEWESLATSPNIDVPTNAWNRVVEHWWRTLFMLEHRQIDGQLSDPRNIDMFMEHRWTLIISWNMVMDEEHSQCGETGCGGGTRRWNILMVGHCHGEGLLSWWRNYNMICLWFNIIVVEYWTRFLNIGMCRGREVHVIRILATCHSRVAPHSSPCHPYRCP